MLLEIKFRFTYQRHRASLLFSQIYSSFRTLVPEVGVSLSNDHQKSFVQLRMYSRRSEKQRRQPRGNVILTLVRMPRDNWPFLIQRPFSSTYHGLHFQQCLNKSYSFEPLYPSEVFQHKVLLQNRFSLFHLIQLCYAQTWY